MKVNIVPKALSGIINAPASKSYAHRLIIGAFLSDTLVEIHGVGASRDVTATVTALTAMGGVLRHEGDVVYVDKRRAVNGEITVNCLESGSTIRFLYPIACALGQSANFTGSERLMQRPMGEIVECVKGHGVNATDHHVDGALTSGTFVIDAGVSSQHVTGLMFALPLLDGDSKIVLTGKVVSRGYLDITVDVLKKFGIVINAVEDGYIVPGNQRYVASGALCAEGDWSGSAFMLCAGALGGPVTVRGLNASSAQGDAKILNVLDLIGAKISVNGDAVTVSRGDLKAISYDCEDVPDLVQTISAVCAYADGESVLSGVDRLRIKESDRINAVLDMLGSAGIKAWYDEGKLHVLGGTPKGASYDGGNDHRTVMSQAVLASLASEKSEITGAEVVDKSYPDFFRDYAKLGGELNG